MSPFKLEISEHARMRLRLRGITRTMVRRCLIEGAIVGLDEKGRRLKRIKIGRRVLEIVYLEISGGYLLVTNYWLGEYL